MQTHRHQEVKVRILIVMDAKHKIQNDTTDIKNKRPAVWRASIWWMYYTSVSALQAGSCCLFCFLYTMYRFEPGGVSSMYYLLLPENFRHTKTSSNILFSVFQVALTFNLIILIQSKKKTVCFLFFCRHILTKLCNKILFSGSWFLIRPRSHTHKLFRPRHIPLKPGLNHL